MSRRKRSAAWTHFNEINETTAACRICKASISFRGGSTANLHRHLRTKHRVELSRGNEPEETAGTEINHSRNTTNPNRRAGSRLPLSCLRLLVSPIRLVSAAIWQTIQKKAVLDYGSLEEFVFLVTEMVPELLSSRQRAELILGLRARLILQLCRFEDTANLQSIQPHLDRMQGLMSLWNREEDPNETSSDSKFLDLVQDLLKDPNEKENFFQNAFLEEFGPKYDEALHTLMCLFLSRFEMFLPIPSFQQIASEFDTACVLEECLESISQSKDLRTLLQYQKGKIGHKDGSLHSDCIISALKLPLRKKQVIGATQSSDGFSRSATLCASEVQLLQTTNMDKLQVDRIKEYPEGEMNTFVYIQGEDGTPVFLGEVTDQLDEALHPLKECQVQLNRIRSQASSRPVRHNSRLKTRAVIDLQTPAVTDGGSVPPDVCGNGEYKELAPIDSCSEDDMWSFYTDSGKSDSCDDCVLPGRNFQKGNLSKVSLKVRDVSAVGAKNSSGVKADTSTKTHSPRGLCCICKEQVKNVTKHMKVHFPHDDFTCPRCDSRFKLLNSLRLHLKRSCFEYNQVQVDPDKPEEAENLHTCDKCEKIFRYKVSLDSHRRTHSDLYCSVCRKVLRDAATLERHKACHTTFQCTRCEASFSVFKPLRKHYENVHEVSRPFKCNHCPKSFTKLRMFIVHEWQHTGNGPFRCVQCGERFRDDNDLISHQRVHTKEKPYLCAECGKAFSRSSNLLRHLNFIHGKSRNEKRFSCSECEKSFKQKESLKKHQRSKHYDQLSRHPCTYCGKMLSASSIERHKLIHTGERPLQCAMPECGKIFRTAAEVKKHARWHHHTERPFRCDICGKGFIYKCLLRLHARVHSGEMPHTCHVCGKAFLWLHSMRRHKRLVHSLIKC